MQKSSSSLVYEANFLLFINPLSVQHNETLLNAKSHMRATPAILIYTPHCQLSTISALGVECTLIVSITLSSFQQMKFKQASVHIAPYIVLLCY
jgi:hypothetical protein